MDTSGMQRQRERRGADISSRWCLYGGATALLTERIRYVQRQVRGGGVNGSLWAAECCALPPFPTIKRYMGVCLCEVISQHRHRRGTASRPTILAWEVIHQRAVESWS